MSDESSEIAQPDADTRLREAIELGLGIVSASTWPARYKVHKYWGRKPANVVARHVEFFTRPGQVVLDPFAGSGVTLVEATRLGRRAQGFDLNPFAVRLSRAMLNPPDARLFDVTARALITRLSSELGALYATRCDGCARNATVRSLGYKGDEPLAVRYRCGHCQQQAERAPDAHDLALLAAPLPELSGAPDADILFGWEMQKLRRRGVKRWRELFTARNYHSAARLREEILKVEDAACREWLLLTLTASLAQCTRMIADFSGNAGGPSWKINCYWLPERWQELNPLWYFQNRVKKSLDSVIDLSTVTTRAQGEVELRDSRVLPLADASVDYAFTDPPYGGEGIQYGELSLLWSLWLGESQDLSREIAFNPYRKLSQEHYDSGLAEVFAETFRVLKPDAFLTVTFANKDPIVWDALMCACREAGFRLITAAPMKRSLPSLTETNMHSAPKADLVLNFQRPQTTWVPVARPLAVYSLEQAVRRIGALLSTDGPAAVHDVFDRVLVDWFSWFYAGSAGEAGERPTLARVSALLRSS